MASVEKPLLGAGTKASSTTTLDDKPKKVCSTPIGVLGVQQETPIAWSSDGTLLAFVSGNFSIYIMHAVGGRFTVKSLLNGHAHEVKNLMFHPTDANVLVSCGFDGVFVWDVASGSTTTRLTHDTPDFHDSDAECVAWAYGATNLVTGGKDATIKVWDCLRDYRHMETITGHKSAVLVIVFNEKVEKMCTAGRDSTIKIWDAHTLAESFREKRSDDSSVQCQLLGNLDGHRGDVTALTFSADGDTLFSGARDNGIKVWSVGGVAEIRDLVDRVQKKDGHHTGDVRRMLFMPGGRHMITAGMDGKLKVWDVSQEHVASADVLDVEAVERNRQAAEAKILEQILGSSTAAGAGSSAVTSVGGGAVTESADKMLVTIMASEHGVWACEASPTAPILATSSSGSSLRLWNVADMARPGCFQEFSGHMDRVNASELLDGDTTLVTCSDDYNVHVYDVRTFTRSNHYDHESSVHAICVRPASGDMRGYILAGGSDYAIKAYPLDATEKQVIVAAAIASGDDRGGVPAPHELIGARFEGHAGKVMCIAVGGNGSLMATGAHDFNIFLWKLEKAYPLTPNRSEFDTPVVRPSARVDAHRGHVHSLKFGFGDTSLLASCGSDHAVKMWRASSGGMMGPKLQAMWSCSESEMGAHDGVVSAITWGKADGADHVFSAGWDHTVKVWNARTAGPASPMCTMKGHTARITDLDSSDSGEFIVSVAADSAAIVWAAGTFKPLVLYRGLSTDGYLSSVSAGLSSFVTASDKGQVTVWPFPGGVHDSLLEDMAVAAKKEEDLLVVVTDGATAPGSMLGGFAGAGMPGAPGASAVGAPAGMPAAPPMAPGVGAAEHK